MVRNVRNFWITANVDGAQREVATGPKSAAGSMHIVLKQREKGTITTAFSIWCHVTNDGKLVTEVTDNTGKVLHKHTTER